MMYHSRIVFNLLLLRSAVAFLFHSSSSTRIGVQPRFMFVDYGLGEYSQEVIDSSKSNKWGIPASETLPPLSSTPKAQLENGGKVTLVGSGPGDPELLTLKAVKLLQEPDALVIVDRLVSPEILNLIQGEIKIARKLPGCAELAQEEIYWWAHQGLSAGKHVIRLKIGDPFVFGRGGEEILKFRQYGVESKVVPGVSSAFSAPLLANIPVTHRGAANQVVMCTGYGREGTSPDLIQYHEEQTIVFLMAVGRLRELCDRLVTLAGYPKDTPVGIVEKAGCPSQRTVIGTMETIADMAEKHKVQAPSTIIVGKVVNVLLNTDDEGVAIQGLIQSASQSDPILSSD
ncbi:uroporphyrinogen III synthase/methyltransferase [Nitzschia inconspicua]|uniref:uroporphyrinogen-III C-methyltransferase n=1 Tax=Nitzschia inconspicua TaxID=303405 RepID=A0A9K3K837_9STRA|nr:uroporphyrinogen III synthase/methyltransferase [Nitzschia inconspicua]KAG7353074.1 uroporphyrinogen III synthase/methyltransferase [Nitzschia inconspicua]